MKTLLHVNYHEGANRLDNLFKIASKYGYDGVELRWRYKFADYDQAGYQAKVAQLKQQYPDFEIVFGGAVNFCRGAKDEVERDTAQYLEFLEWAKANCGTKVMNFFTGGLNRPGAQYVEFDRNGSGYADEGDYERSAEGLRIVGAKAESLGILIALETHNCYLHALPGPCRKLLDTAGAAAVGINFDQGNIILNKNGTSIQQCFDLLGDKIHYAHLKNMFIVRGYNASGYIGCRLSDGHINNMTMMEGLKKHLKSGIFAVEYPNTGDGIYAAYKDIEYIKFLKDYLEIE